MFEGKLPRREAAAPLAHGKEAALRPLDWSELVSRLAAARDARASLLAGDAAREASFDADSALRIAAHRDADDPVNPEDSANLKNSRGTSADTSPASRRDPRNT